MFGDFSEKFIDRVCALSVGVSYPAINSIELSNIEVWYPVEAYVDSGATYSIFSHKFADRIGLDFKGGRLIYAQVGDGGSIPAYLHDLEVQLGAERLTGRIGVSEKLGIGFNLSNTPAGLIVSSITL